MAINSRKISSFPTLAELTGSEYIMVAYNNKSYKIPTSLLISNVIKSITQIINVGDGKDNPITITLNDDTKQTFHVYNGKQGATGKQGEPGKQGPQGKSGVALYNTDVQDIIYNDLTGEGYDDEELAQMILSAKQGVKLGDMLDGLQEVYLATQAEYDSLLANDKIDENIKYLIFEE